MYFILQMSINLTSVFVSAFDPRPFIRTFESAVDRLIEVRKDLQRQTDALEKSVKPAERDYSRKMTELNGGFEVTRIRPPRLKTTINNF